jgi:hypothetical protein
MSAKTVLIIESFTCIVPIYIGIRYFRCLTNDLKAMTLYMVSCLLCEIPNNYLLYHNINNLFILHIFTVIEFVFLAYVYSFHIKSVINKRLLFGGTIAFVVLAVLNTIYVQPLSVFNSYARCAEILIILFLALCYVHKLIVNNEQRQLRTFPMFWINTAVVIYFTAGFFLYLVSNNTIGLSPNMNRAIWMVHGALLVGYYFAIAKAIWIKAKQ